MFLVLCIVIFNRYCSIVIVLYCYIVILLYCCIGILLFLSSSASHRKVLLGFRCGCLLYVFCLLYVLRRIASYCFDSVIVIVVLSF